MYDSLFKLEPCVQEKEIDIVTKSSLSEAREDAIRAELEEFKQKSQIKALATGEIESALVDYTCVYHIKFNYFLLSLF